MQPLEPLSSRVGPHRGPPTFYSVCSTMVRWFFHLAYDFDVRGLDRVPLKGDVVFAANHASFLDPPAVGCMIDRHLAYFARDTLWKGLLGNVLDKLEAIPVRRGDGDVKSLRRIFNVLGNGGAVVVFPEGTRTEDGTLQEAKGGAGMIACRNQSTVVPVRIFGSFEAYQKGAKLPRINTRIRVVYGKPLAAADYDPGKAHPERYLEASKRIMAAIAKLEDTEKNVV